MSSKPTDPPGAAPAPSTPPSKDDELRRLQEALREAQRKASDSRALLEHAGQRLSENVQTIVDEQSELARLRVALVNSELRLAELEARAARGVVAPAPAAPVERASVAEEASRADEAHEHAAALARLEADLQASEVRARRAERRQRELEAALESNGQRDALAERRQRELEAALEASDRRAAQSEQQQGALEAALESSQARAERWQQLQRTLESDLEKARARNETLEVELSRKRVELHALESRLEEASRTRSQKAVRWLQDRLERLRSRR
ncbi:MAG: hypothetical protein KC503_24005 [Myxococcales bacterium]|nr:hypothetical protein [Myxococcales bacterium]